MNNNFSLCQLGWQPYFQQQLNLKELESSRITRVIGHHRTHYTLQSPEQILELTLTPNLTPLTVGDWVLLDENDQFQKRLERKSIFKRRSPGTKVAEQLIAANVDTLFIVCSVNHDFNLNRIERFLALANEAMVEPVVVLTKKDLCTDLEHKKQLVQKLDNMLIVETVNGLDKSSVDVLTPWCRTGKTVSFIGSSGVGKSTLVNTLLGEYKQQTASIRDADSKGRHTTRARSMSFLTAGGAIIDTPGIRELQLTDCEAGVQQTFDDIEQLTKTCKFSNCSHQSEPGCTVTLAITEGKLEQRRFNNYQKLLKEQARNLATLKEKRDKDRAFSKHCKVTMADSVAQKRGR